jgi:hypothetical protein
MRRASDSSRYMKVAKLIREESICSCLVTTLIMGAQLYFGKVMALKLKTGYE